MCVFALQNKKIDFDKVLELTVWHNIYLKMISCQTAAHWPYVEAPFPFYLVFYDRAQSKWSKLPYVEISFQH